ncbi:hypothetical protein C7C45_11310 [Micromonospora arborensis]|uniref:Nitrate/nitrite sensing protein domain-containing protein n=1 Tax=Micromonospora arborensis TaxID=2116518 RepID=A0A318NKW8_9ACTN|nr:hypothetical protein [Micromonospora arborensis]PYC71607.1 hypothetical protein C7C45_11310 [Micromonospora arborensis]
MLLLAPVAVLFQQAHPTSDDRASVQRERDGARYLRPLGQVAVALVDAQSAAVAGRPASGEPLKEAVAEMAVVDTRLGGELLARERWAGLRAKIDALPNRGADEAADTMATYSEAADLLLGLYRKVREASGLARDSVADTYYLQDGAAEELPEALVNVGRFSDLAMIASGQSSEHHELTIANLGTYRSDALSSADDLIDDLLAAETENVSLSSGVLGEIDAFQRAMETLGAVTFATKAKPSPAGTAKPTSNGKGDNSDDADPAGSGHSAATSLVVDVAQVRAARTTAQDAAAKLNTAILNELDGRLSARADDLDGQRRRVLGVTALAVALAVTAVWVALPRRVRRRRRAGRRDTSSLSSPMVPQPAAPPALQSRGGVHPQAGYPALDEDSDPKHWNRTNAAR